MIPKLIFDGDMSDKFVAICGEDRFQELCESLLDDTDLDWVYILDKQRINACNIVCTGIATIDDREFYFRCEQGDINGCVFEFGDDRLEIPEDTTPSYTFAPINPGNRFAMRNFELQKTQPWFTEMQGKMNYDMFFAPGGKTEKHYREWAKSKGLTIAIS